MDYEKKYKEAIKKAKSKVKNDKDHVLYEDDIIDIFPELAESEDERIRKVLIELSKEVAQEQFFTNRGTNLQNVIAWLEKQGKQNLANSAKTCKVEPKFKVGDWVVWDNKISCHIDNIYQGKESLMYTITDVHNMTRSYSVKGFDNNAHLWTIQDAKDGSVLSFNDGHGNDCIELIKSITDKKIEFWFCLTNGNRYEVFDGIIPYTNLVSREDATPATKEQRDTLFAKMKEAGYEWNAEKKELKKIVAPIFNIGDRVRYKEHACDGVITEITDTDYICGDAKLPISTQDKLELVEQKTAEWGKRQVINAITTMLTEKLKPLTKKLSDGTISHREDMFRCALIEIRSFVNSPSFQIGKGASDAWSEKDEVALSDALWCCKQAASIAKDENDMGNVWYAEHWLKSLKDRYAWKPSEEQLGIIAQSVAVLKVSGYDELGDRLGDISEQLNKLREK